MIRLISCSLFIFVMIAASYVSAESACPDQFQGEDRQKVLVNCIKSLEKKISTLESSLDKLSRPFDLESSIVEMRNEGTLKNKILGKNKFCGISAVENNNHTNQACSCNVKQDSGVWVLSVKNQSPDLYCACGAICVK